jgi:hypothetical protein
MTEEYQSILKNDVWDIVPRPEGNSVVTSKWIYKIKHAADGSVEKYTVEILKRFEIIDYGSMPTPMMMNLEKMNKASSGSAESETAKLLEKQDRGAIK